MRGDHEHGLLSATSSIAPGDTQTFTYTAAMPETFEGESGTGGCETGTFPVADTVTLAGEAGEDSVTVCVEAAAAFTVEKTADAERPPRRARRSRTRSP